MPSIKRRCAFKGCDADRSKIKTSFFIFPKNEELFHKWALKSGRLDLIGKNLHWNRIRPFLCGKHFRPEDVDGHLGAVVCSVRKGAIPSTDSSISKFDEVHEYSKDASQTHCSPKGKENSENECVKKISGNHADVGIQCKELVSNTPINLLYVQFQPNFTKDITGNQFDVGFKAKLAKNIQGNQVDDGIQCKVLHDSQSTRNAAIQTSEDYKFENPEVLSLKKKLKAKSTMISYYKNKLKKGGKDKGAVLNNRGEFLQEAKHWISGPFLHLLNAQVEGSKKFKFTYSANTKHIAYALHFASPTMYRTLGNIMKLPSERSLRGWILGLQMQAGISTPIFELLKSKVSAMSNKEKVVCIYFDEVSLKPTLEYKIGSDEIFGHVDCGVGSRTDDPANSALVCMIRGLFVNWKQPISFIFTEGTASQTQLDNFVSGNLFNLTKVGLFPVCVTTNLGTNFRNYFNNRGASAETPFIVHDETKFFIMPNTTHLIKSVISCLMSQTIITREGTACWGDIKTCYDSSKKNGFQSFHKVKPHYISSPPVGEKINLSLATKVLSNSMSTAISTMVTQQCMRDDAKGTASLCARFNNLFDILNSSVRKDPAPFKRALFASSESYEYLRGSLSFLNSLQIVNDINEDVTCNFPWIQDWKQAIHAVSGLLEYLKCKYQLKHILTRRLCLEDLENFFNDVMLGDHVDEDPSCREFINAFKKVFCMNIRCPIKSNNTGFDTGAALLEFASEMNAEMD